MAITAQDLYNYTTCAHRVYLDAHGDPADRAAVNEFVRLLWEKGLQTEREHLAGLAGIPYEDLSGLPLDEAIEQTTVLMQRGAALLYQAAIRTGEWVGRPDLLVRRDDAASTLGPFHYEPIDIKAGHGWEMREGDPTKFKEHYAYQILFYREILRAIQGYLPGRGRIINVDNEIEEFDPADFETEFRAAVKEVERLVAGSERSEPVLSSACALCQWYPKCRRWVEATHDPTKLFFVGKQKFALKAKGLGTIQAISVMDVDTYLKEPNKIPRMGRTSLERMKRRAQVMLAGTPEIRTGYAFPAAPEEIYFDIEDDPTQGLTYLFGLVLRDHSRRDEFQYFLAERPEDEGDTARRFWEFLREHPEAAIYVYSSKERTTLRSLMTRYTLDPIVFERYRQQEVDLYQLVVKYSDWPTSSYGIKQIATQVGFAWRDPDPGGANSIVWYNEYRRDPADRRLIERIIEYNEDDCRAMIAVKEYFQKKASATDKTRKEN